jgi:hypothetical protein
MQVNFFAPCGASTDSISLTRHIGTLGLYNQEL